MRLTGDEGGQSPREFSVTWPSRFISAATVVPSWVPRVAQVVPAEVGAAGDLPCSPLDPVESAVLHVVAGRLHSWEQQVLRHPAGPLVEVVAQERRRVRWNLDAADAGDGLGLGLFAARRSSRWWRATKLSLPALVMLGPSRWRPERHQSENQPGAICDRGVRRGSSSRVLVDVREEIRGLLARSAIQTGSNS